MKPDQRTVVVGEKSAEAMRAEWMEAVGDVTRRQKKPTGAGWLTRVEIRKLLNWTEMQFYRRLRALKKCGKVDIFKGNSADKTGSRLTNQVWYRLK